MEKPKVLIFTTSYFPFIGGAEVAVGEICERLKDRFDFFIVTSRFRRDLPKIEIRPEGTVIRLGFGGKLDKWFLPFLFLLHNYRGSTSIVFGLDISTGALGAALYKIFHPRTAFILNIQYGYGDERLASGRFGGIGTAFKFMLRQADFVTAISSYLLDTAQKYGYHGPAEIIPNGVDINKFKRFKGSKVKGDKKIVITTSRLVPKNGIDMVIKAVAEVRKIIPDIQCWILGDGPEKESLKFKVKSLKLENEVKFLGNVVHEKIPEYLHQADIFVRPSRSEGMGNSFVEALAAGLPIIGTPVGGIPDIIKDVKTGLLVKVDDPDDLAQKIIKLFSDQNLSVAIVREGEKMVAERFSWDKISASYGKLFSRYRNRTSIVIATPLFPPQLGGPALYAKNLAGEFKKMGYRVEVSSFGKFLKYPSIFRHLWYAFSLLRPLRRADMLLALDYFSVGFPAAFMAKMFRTPLILRWEGDFLWEEYVERTRRDLTLREFYRNPPPFSLKEKIIWRVSNFVAKSASRISFSSEWRRKMVVGAFKIPPEKTVITRNVFPPSAADTTGNEKLKVGRSRIILWAGRMLYLKNLYRLLRVFSRINRGDFELQLVGDGPEKDRLVAYLKEKQITDVKISPALSHEELLKKFADVAFFVFPSLSDVGPNVIADSIESGRPFIMSKESGFFEYLKDIGLFFDPLNEKDLEEKMKILMDERGRKEYEDKLSRFRLFRGWSEAAEDWSSLFKAVKDAS